MLFITNRRPTQSLRSSAGRTFTFDLRANTPSPDLFFCESGKDNKHTEIMSKGLLERLKADAAKHILLYIHGFNVSPDEALQAATALQKITDKAKGAGFALVVPLIWPADAEKPFVKKYYSDRDSATDSRSAFARALSIFVKWQQKETELCDRCRKPISVLAHSMGCRVLRETLSYTAAHHDL